MRIETPSSYELLKRIYKTDGAQLWIRCFKSSSILFRQCIHVDLFIKVPVNIKLIFVYFFSHKFIGLIACHCLKMFITEFNSTIFLVFIRIDQSVWLGIRKNKLIFLLVVICSYSKYMSLSTINGHHVLYRMTQHFFLLFVCCQNALSAWSRKEINTNKTECFITMTSLFFLINC